MFCQICNYMSQYIGASETGTATVIALVARLELLCEPFLLQLNSKLSIILYIMASATL